MGGFRRLVAALGPSRSHKHGRRPPAAFVLVGRVLLLVVAGLAVAAVVGLTRQPDRTRAQAKENAAAPYLCPMHAEVVSPVPGECPVCGMALERSNGAEVASSTATGGHRAIDVQKRVTNQAVRGEAWTQGDGLIMAVFYKDELVGLDPGDRVLFFPRTNPAAGRRAYRLLEPPVARSPTTVWARFLLDGKPLPPTTGWVQLKAKPRELLVVPESAVLYSEEGAYVLAAPADSRTFSRHAIEVGRTLDAERSDLAGDRFGLVVVLSGLVEGERVIVKDSPLLEAERRLQAAQGRSAEGTE